MTNLKSVEILTYDEARQVIPKWPADVSFSEPYARFNSNRYRLKSGFIYITYSSGQVLIIPVQWGKGEAYSVYKAHTTPFQIGSDITDPEWHFVGAEVRRLTQSALYIADMPMVGSMRQGLVPLASALHTLDTSGHDIAKLFSAFHETSRKRVRRAQRQNFRIEIVSGRMSDAYYELYVRHQKSKGTPPREKKYFDDTAEAFQEGFVLIGAYEGEALVGMNLAWCADRAMWLSINSSLPEYADKNVNYILYYETIKWACEHMIDRIDFGGTSTRDGQVHNSFKVRLGATTDVLYRLVDGTLYARFLDKVSRKRRALSIRVNKVRRLWT